MKKILFYSILCSATFWSCNKAPISGRNQLLLINDTEINQQSFLAYKSFLDTSKVAVPSNYQTQMVKRVGEKIATAAQKYFASIGQPNYLSDYKWETNLVQNNQINAWCMPGGKMVVYTGILPVTQSEAGLAVVMGHEVSHAVAKHGNERMSQGMLAQGLLTIGGAGLQVAMANKSAQTQALWNNVFGLAAPAGTQLALLAYGRTQESESDHLGLIFMAIAGYNPEEAINFWQRMSAASGNAQKPPQFLSTHPSDDTRIADIRKLLPKALKYYTPPTPTYTSPPTPSKPIITPKKKR